VGANGSQLAGFLTGAATRGRRIAWWLTAVAVAAGVTALAMWQEVVATGQVASRGTAFDFASTTWRAVRGLLAGQDVYATSAYIPGIGQVTPTGEHLPASLIWQAPFAALPLWPAFLAFDLASIIAIWAAVLIVARPRSPQAVLLAAGCGAFAILAGGGPWTLLIGQSTAFALLGLALVVRVRRPWLCALGAMLAASTFQTGVPLAMALIVLRAWPVVWRAAVMTVASSLPPVVLGISAAGGLGPYVRAFTAGAFGHLAPMPGALRRLADQPDRIDLGALLHRAGVSSTVAQVAAGVVLLALALWFLARLPAELRRLDYPPVLCLVIAVTLLCAYHQPYDMLLLSGAVIPAVVLWTGERSGSALAVFALAGIGAGLTGNTALAVIVDPVCLLAIAAISALMARRVARRSAASVAGQAVGLPGCPTGPDFASRHAVADSPPRPGAANAGVVR
jgi:hypothetical protein